MGWEEKRGERTRREQERGEGLGGEERKEEEARRTQRKWWVKESLSEFSCSKPTKASGFLDLVHFIPKGRFVYIAYFELFEISLPNLWVYNFSGRLFQCGWEASPHQHHVHK